MSIQKAIVDLAHAVNVQTGGKVLAITLDEASFKNLCDEVKPFLGYKHNEPMLKETLVMRAATSRIEVSKPKVPVNGPIPDHDSWVVSPRLFSAIDRGFSQCPLAKVPGLSFNGIAVMASEWMLENKVGLMKDGKFVKIIDVEPA